ncbi:hypothetical protein J2X31_001614 [Flavobacterium arsenatis]|uniref:DUF4249 domain-containing protein n=1 Tax=Flavobacterium arsenatis TaxID=1484332 RepID=A0ABU1TP79_9FLAO|nr:DUF4249 domain-containing protein [Flavobacterium arsenatis]MDR6967602.1 hypothetical protein [Flavobacterium arsenatis]
MKNLKYISVILIALFFTSCEDVIDVDLPTGEPKLVVDASINWQLGTTGNEQTIKLTTSTGYYQPTVPTVSGATVFVTNTDTNQVFDFVETIGTGQYVCSTFEPVLDGNYQLTVITGGQTYTATEKLMSVVPIDKIEQKEAPFGDDSVEINVFFTDNGATDDFYMFRYITSFGAIPNYGVSDDEFFQGNQFNDVYFNEELKPGASFDVTIFGVSEQFYNYMNLLLDIAGGGGPFATAPAKVKGNILNTTDAQNTAFGYFRLSQTDTRNYVVE